MDMAGDAGPQVAQQPRRYVAYAAGGVLMPNSAWMGPLAVLVALAACGQRGTSPSDAGLVPDTAVGAWEAGVSDAPDDRRAAGTFDAPAVPDQPSSPDAAPDVLSTPTQDAANSYDSSETALACSGICNAATPSYPTVGPDVGRGNITMYTTEASSGGACNYGATSVLYFAAVNVNVTPGDGRGQWQGGRICGQCIEVTALTTQGPQSVVVRIMDKCPDGYCGIDLGGAAPAAIMRDGFGRYNGTWRFVSCTGHPEVSDGPTSLCVSSGANAYWSRVQVRNPPGAVESIEWQSSQGGSGTLPYASDPEDTFEVPPALLQSAVPSLTLTARFSDGSTATAELSPTQLGTENASYVMK